MTKRRAAQLVGVIFSRADFRRALRMRNPPDLFELRLDGLTGHIDSIERAIGELPAPLIITARHPREGGSHQLSSSHRRKLLLRFLPRAAWVDIELRSARAMATVLRAAKTKNVGLIISLHDFLGTPASSRLEQIVDEAQSLGAKLVKIAARTDTPADLKRLLHFFDRPQEVVVMGVGKLGRKSRLELARRSCALNYAHLGTPQVAGQLSVAELRRALR